MSKADQYSRGARGWTSREYADSAAYLDHRAELIASLGAPLRRGDTVLDLACGDGGLGAHLVARGLRYAGVDATPAMIEEARRLWGEGARFEVGDLNEYEPPEPVQATTVFRAIYYARDMGAFFRRARGYTEVKLVFDLNPRQYPVGEVVADLRSAGFGSVALRPFFVPQTVRLPGPLVRALTLAERAGPLARLPLRYRFTYLVAASSS